ncbi:SDR family oxidoreductase [Legionella spiritensis]|uniref:Oxidoreductase n=1 Tax=Legionella spiritensis TaxID=452 RepID=A0A0W0YYS0_LEGSP|nr:SDR family oxidoreductase [Legionella spiritensis]KTD61986.1 oxidoreductase [Legionella spiritensis]SNV34947.1 oxidoreductase [Legionella spiritensis]
MRILITGANGFIGGYLVAYLLKQGHEITCCARDVASTERRFPLARTIACDFNRDLTIDAWLPRVQDMDAVINCAGILKGSRRQNINNIHYQAPLALFQACEQSAIPRVIQLSALGVEDGPDIDYVTTKRRLDETLQTMNLSSCILRPSLVYANGAYGGTALLRALASLPWIIPLIDSGDARFQPVAMFDLVKVFEQVLHGRQQGIINVVGPRPVAVRDILIHLRQWLGFGYARTVSMSSRLIKPLTKLGDRLALGPLNSVSYQMTLHENMADYQPLRAVIDFDLAPFPEGLNYYPSQTQDRWHARLYFLRPLLKISLVLLWLLSGLIPLLGVNQQAEHLLLTAGIPQSLVAVVQTGSCLWDMFLGMALLFSFKNKWIGLLQFATIAVYTVVGGIGLAWLWLDPLAPLLKNIPILTAVLIWLAIEDMR